MSTKKKLTRKEKIALQRQKKAEARQEQQRKSTGKKSLWILGGIVAALGFLLYLNTTGHGYVLDDFSVIKDNWVIKKGLDGISTILQTSYRHGYFSSEGTLYRPLSLLMYAVEWHFFPDQPSVSHFINILLYAITGWVLFFTLHKVFRRYNVLLPFLISILYIAHPIHTEVVANIKSRDEILAFLFLLLAVNWVLRFVKTNGFKFIAGALLFYFLAFLSKENAITFLAVIPLTLYFFRDITIRKNAIITGAFAGVAGLYLLIRKAILGDVTGVKAVSVMDNLLTKAPDFMSQTATAVMILGKYFLLLVFPHPLVCDYSYNQIPIVEWSNIWPILSLLFYLAITAFALLKLKKKDLIAFGILFFIITFSVYSNLLVIIGSSFGERFLYIPSLGFCIVVAVLLMKLFKSSLVTEEQVKGVKEMILHNKGLFGIVAVILVGYSFKTVDRNKDWESDLTLYSADVKKSSNSARTHYYYGLELMKQKAMKASTEQEKIKYLNKAIEEFSRATEIYKPYSDAYDQMGLAYYRKGNNQKALENYQKALNYNPAKATTYSNMGAIYFNAGDYRKALEVYQKAVQYDPRYADAYLNLGSVNGTLGRYEEAIQAYLNGLKYEPDNPLMNYYLGLTYQTVGKKQLGQRYLNKAYQLQPSLKK